MKLACRYFEYSLKLAPMGAAVFWSLLKRVYLLHQNCQIGLKMLPNNSIEYHP